MVFSIQKQVSKRDNNFLFFLGNQNPEKCSRVHTAVSHIRDTVTLQVQVQEYILAEDVTKATKKLAPGVAKGCSLIRIFVQKKLDFHTDFI